MQTQPNLEPILGMYREHSNDRWHTALFVGPKGVGKSWNIKKLICDCSQLELKERILLGKSPDVLEFMGSEGISEFRERIDNFDFNPKELPSKWLILNNLDFYSSEILDTLLKTLEDSRIFHILCTSRTKHIKETILSRLHVHVCSPWGIETLKEVLSSENKYAPLLRHIDKYPFQSFFEIDSYTQYDMENCFKSIYSASMASDLFEQVDKFLGKVKELPIYEKLPVMEFFLFFYIYRALEKPPENKPRFKYYLDKLILRFGPSLFEQLQNPRYHSVVNLEEQYRAFLLSIFSLKIIS